MIKLKLLACVAFIVFFFACSKSFVWAQDDFYIDSSSSYTVTKNATTTVSQKIVITNRKEFVYSPSYSITLHLKNISGVSATNSTTSIPFTEKGGALDAKTFTLSFPDKVVGAGHTNTFNFSYTTPDLAKKSGDIWHVTIPGTANPETFENYSVSLTVPPSFGAPSIVKPQVAYDTQGSSYVFNKNSLSSGGIEVFFGSPQVYKFNLSYHLENTNPFPITTEIALPPSTNYQEVLLQNLTPKPVTVYKDEDGNWLARYNMSPKTSYTVFATALIKVSQTPSSQSLSSQEKNLFTQEQKFWEVNDPEIQKIAKTLTTPEQIYNYVVKTLSYSDSKTDKENVRLGAKKVLSEPYFAVCLEFSDLFVALARANGIPARVVEGYGYTEGESTKPLSLVTDTLHAWPEYYDTTKNTWVMVDPTWGNTTDGVDFFHELDFDHVAFVLNGKDSTYPIPAGGYKGTTNTKDVDVSFVSVSDFVADGQSKFSASFSSFRDKDTVTGDVKLDNTGNVEIKSYPIYISLDNGEKELVALTSIPPYGSKSVSVSLALQKQGFLNSLTNVSHTVTITDASNNVLYKKDIRVYPFSILIVIGGAIICAAGIVFIIAIKTRSIPV